MLNEREIIDLVEGLTVLELNEWVEKGWVVPQKESGTLHYREVDVARVQFIIELRQDLQIDEESLPVILSLVDQVYGLRSELHIVAEAIQTQSEDVRRRIVEYVRQARAGSSG